MSALCLEPQAQSGTARVGALRRVLFVCYQFPPVGGAGVQRPTKFVKYLRQFGWEATVLMPSNPSVPVFDESLLAELPDDQLVIKAPTWEPDYRVKSQVAGGTSASATGLRHKVRRIARRAAGLVLQPDPQMLWIPQAYRAGCRLLKELRHDAIFATAPPYSDFVLGALLKRKSGLPLILDYRDEWDLSSKYLENSQHDRFSLFAQERLQRWVLRRADAVVATTRASTHRLDERIASAGGTARTECIYNGYDEVDFPVPCPVDDHAERAADRKFRLVYAGTLWNLTSVAPVAEAVARLRDVSPELLSRLELVFVGRKLPAQHELLRQIAAAGCTVIEQDYCEHHQIPGLLRSADGLCLLLSEAPGAERVVPAKLFEYLAAGKPILGICPSGESADLLKQSQPESHFIPSDVAGIARWLETNIRSCEAGEVRSHRVRNNSVEQFSRRAQAGQLAGLLDQLVAQSRGHS
jgi:glycosyltransferase involved in cell wall biosynthesis